METMLKLSLISFKSLRKYWYLQTKLIEFIECSDVAICKFLLSYVSNERRADETHSAFAALIFKCHVLKGPL